MTLCHPGSKFSASGRTTIITLASGQTTILTFSSEERTILNFRLRRTASSVHRYNSLEISHRRGGQPAVSISSGGTRRVFNGTTEASCYLEVLIT
jgi:hypothetical protein